MSETGGIDPRQSTSTPVGEPSADLTGEPGILGSLRSFADTAVGSVQDRLELLSLELHEEKNRLTLTLVWIVVFGFTALLALMFISAAIVLVFWHTRARLAVVAALGAAYTLCAVVAAVAVRRHRRQPPPFAGTLEELRNDRECLQRKS